MKTYRKSIEIPRTSRVSDFILVKLIITAICTALAIPTPQATAQERNDAGKEIVKGLLRALVESQLDRDGQRRNEAGNRPGQGLRPDERRPNLPNQSTAQIQQLRPVIATLSQEVTTLTALMNTDARRSFEVRRLLGDGLRLQATVASMKQRLEREKELNSLMPAFLTLNATWKTLFHQLNQSASISPQTIQCAERINRLDAQYCGILGIQEQFESRDLVRAADTLAANLRSLSDELTYSGSTPDRFQLLAQLRRLEERSHLLANLASNGATFQSVVQEYQSNFTAWQPLRIQLATFPNRTITRAVSRIEESHRTIHQLLRLDIGLNTSLTLQIAQQIQKDVGVLYRSITLEQMMMLRDHRGIALSADIVAGSVENLVDLVNRNESRQAVAEGWFLLDESWRVLHHYLSPISAPEVRRQIAVISQSTEALRQSIDVHVEFDQSLITTQAASLSGNADAIHASFKRWLRVSPSGLEKLHRDVDLLEEKCHELEPLCAKREDARKATQRIDEIIVIWQQIRPELLRCPTPERSSLEQLSDVFTQEIVRLRTMIAE
ncbi:MAG: hypothetical protein KDA91_04920 [Planctomycetaceae bacterium]|nr:hypothetical protein [Planctomycetaceae bacterium]